MLAQFGFKIHSTDINSGSCYGWPHVLHHVFSIKTRMAITFSAYFLHSQLQLVFFHIMQGSLHPPPLKKVK